MTTWEQRRSRREEVGRRASFRDHMYSYCRVPGCPNPARAGTADGLDMRYCSSHADHFQRHGSTYKGSYRAKVINPYRQAALVWLLDNPDEFWVRDAVGKVEGLYSRAGRNEEAFRLRGLSPRERAWVHWARLREHQVDPKLPVAAWLSIEMVIQDDPQPDLSQEYKQVQGAKLVHRMASGSHRSWVRERPHPLHPGLPPIQVVDEAHWYPQSRGRVLRHIGTDLQGAC